MFVVCESNDQQNQCYRHGVKSNSTGQYTHLFVNGTEAQT